MAFDWQAELASQVNKIVVNHSIAAMAHPPPKPAHNISFMQALTASSNMISSNDNLPQPLIRGESVSIHISQAIYEKGMAVCKRNLRGRLVLNKGDKPYTAKDIHSKLQNQWKMMGAWSMTPLGRGFYEFFFASKDDMRMVWAKGTVNLKPGVLRLFEWTKDFNMHKQRNAHAQVWIRLLELPQEYWMDRTLREIASVVGTPLLIDNATSKRIFGHYARILVDMDFSRKLFHEITVEREGYAFNVVVAYEWLPKFCTHCQTIGHDVSSCRWLYPRKDSIVHKEKIVQGKKPVPTTKQNWVPIKDNPSGIGSSLAFAAPQKNVDLVTAETETHTITVHQQEIPKELEQHATIVVDEPVQHSAIDDVSDEKKNMGADSSMIEGNIVQQLEDTVANISPPLAATVNRTLDVSQNSSSMPLTNVIDVVARSAIVVTHEPIITPVTSLDINSIRADPDATVDPTLQKEIDFMKTWLDKAAVNEDVPFSPVVSKSQKKKLAKQNKEQTKATYLTRVHSHLLNEYFILEHSRGW